MNPFPVAALSLFAALLPAQTFVVDAANGPGTHFPSLAAAIPAVPDGATLLVRAGAYDGNLTISGKGLTILGQAGARIVVPSNGAWSVQGLGANQTVVVRGFVLELQGVFGDFQFQCQGNQGLVVIENLTAVIAGYGSTRFAADTCAAVLLRDCTFRGAVTLVDSVAVLEHCTISSAIVAPTHFAQTRGRVQLVDCTVRGPNGSTPAQAAACVLDHGDLRVLGASRLEGGFVTFTPFGYAIAGVGTVRLSPQVVLIGGAPQIEPSVTATTLEMPKVTAASTALGSPVTATMTGPANGLGVLAVGFPGPVSFAPGLADPFLWSPATVVTVAVGPLGPVPLGYTCALPAPPAWPGLALVWQGVSLDPVGGLQASQPGVTIAF